jgi:hypothetical protein
MSGSRPARRDDPPLLDPDVGLHHAEQRIDHQHAADQHVELALGRGSVELRHP